MKIKFYGTRGSVSIAGPQAVKYGGNTTCLRIESPCLPPKHWLAIDAGTGIFPLGNDTFKPENGGIETLTILFSHYHHDHILGLFLCPLTFMKKVKINCYGPIDNEKGPADMLKDMMRPPYFPVDFAEVASHFSAKGIDHMPGMCLLVHPTGGVRLLKIDELELLEQKSPTQIPFRDGKYAIQECLVIKMFRANHPERTVSYRFEERPTGKTFVFLTDHENTDGLPGALVAHLKDADLLVIDSQYTREKYDRMTAGFGHGTPDYAVKLAIKVKAKALGLTHHDPSSSDQAIDGIVEAAKQAANEEETKYDGEIFACADYQTVEL